jgi:hypothetical protein
MKYLRQISGLSLGEAKNVVSTHPAWGPVVKAAVPLHDELGAVFSSDPRAEDGEPMNEPDHIPDGREVPLSDSEGPIPTFPPVAIDPVTGRMLPMSDEERAARRAAAIRAIKAIRQITDETDTDERWREVYRGIDEGRPHRKLFEGMY